MKNIYQILEELGIKYEKYDHPAVYTVNEGEKYFRGEGGHTKNLFLRNKKSDRHYLVVVEASKRVNLKQLALILGENGFSFASPERMLLCLGLTPGSVSPFGLINDSKKEVYVIVDKDLLKFKKQGYHPNVNTSTLVIDTKDFKKFLEWTKNKVTYLNLS